MEFEFKSEAVITLYKDEINHFFSIVDKITPDISAVGFKSNKFTKKEMKVIDNLNAIKNQLYVSK